MLRLARLAVSAIIAAALLSVAALPARAQEAGDYWSGTLALTPAINLTIGLNIVAAPTGGLGGTIDSPDQHAFDIPIAGVERDASRLAFTVPSLGGIYSARWNAAGQAWQGTWLQNGQAWPLVLRAGARPSRTAAAPLPADWQVPGGDEIRAIIAQRLRGRPGAGMVVGVLGPSGTQVIGQGAAEDDLFEIGSITKVFTALLLAEAVQRGEVRLDDRAGLYLPPGAAMPGNGGDAITLRQLSQHRSGLPRLPDNMPFTDPADPYADYTGEMLLDFLRSYALTREPGAQFEYSNLGVGLLGQVLASAAGTDYETLVNARILAPLGMSDTAITLSPAQEARFAARFDEYMRPARPWHLPALAGAGALRSTARDMLRFLGAVLDPASPLAPATALTLEGWQPAAGEVTGLGWMGFAPAQGPVMFHSGGTGGYRSAIALQPATGRAVVVLTNAAAEPSAEDIAFHLIAGTPLAPSASVPPPPAPVEWAEIALTTAQLDRLTGTYRLAPGVNGVVRREGQGLTAQLTGQPALPIFASGPLDFFWRAVDAQVTFTEEDGRITGAVLHQNGQDIALEKID